MDQLTDIVKQTYLRRFDELELEYQFHFASRMYAWTGDTDARQRLEQLKEHMVPMTHDGRVQALHTIEHELAIKDYERDVNNYARRKPFFAAYPKLLLVHNALFRIRHWWCVYGIDERESLFTLVPKEDVETMLVSLMDDEDALRVLSTYAINTLYLYETLFETPIHFQPERAMAVAAAYDRTTKADIQLLIYLYTHCIIGASLFYYQPVTRDIQTYHAMLQEIEELIDVQYDTITLDNKFEFLVCARLCGYASHLANKIYDEASISVNDQGFIVDTVNRAINPVKQSFLMSEHRNVLFIMSVSEPAFSTDFIR